MLKFLRTFAIAAAMLLPFAFGPLCAQEEVTIGDLEGATNNSYLPMNSLYNYSYTQQIYTADEVGMAGTITSLTVWMYGNTNLYEMPFTIYMMETAKESFESNTDWVTVTADDLVYTGSVTVHNTEAEAFTFELDAPFDYSGTGNLLIAFNNTTGNWKSGLNGKVFGASSDPVRAIYVRQDASAYDPYNPTFTATSTTYQRNVITLGITTAGGSNCAKPANLTVSDITGHEATFSWESEVGNYVFEYKPASSETWVSVTATANTVTIEALAPETAYDARVKAVCGAGNESGYRTIGFTTDVACPKPTGLTVDALPTSAVATWNGSADSYVLEYALIPTDPDAPAPADLHYDNGTYGTSIGLGGSAFSWGVMFPASSLEANHLSSVSVYDNMAMTGTLSIYNDGDAVPTDLILTQDIEFTGVEDFVDFTTDVTIDPTKNLWVVFYNASGATYPAACSEDVSDDPNGRWVEISGNWYDMANVGVEGYTFMIHAHVDALNTADLVWTTVNPAASPATLTGLTPESNYALRVKASCGAGEESAWVSSIFATPSACATPTGVTVSDITSNSATLTWNGYQSSYNVRYRVAAGSTMYFFEDFENLEDGELPEGWISIDADGDGEEWYSQAGYAQYSHSGEGCVTSASYNGGVLTPDNWLVTPLLDLQGTMKVWMRAQDPSYPEEHYAIYLSTTGNEVEDFTTVLVAEASDLTGEYIEVTADLSQYAGQQGYIAIRHFNCTDMFRMNVDDFGLFGASHPAGEWVTMTTASASAALSGLSPLTVYEYQVQGICEGSTTEWTDLATFTTLSAAADPCAAPVITSTDATDVTVTVTFTGSAENYEVAIVEGAWSEPVSGAVAITTNSYTFSGLTPATQYTVGVRSVCDDELASAWVTAPVNTIDAACEAVTNVSVSGETVNSATVAWTLVDESQTAWEVNVTGTGFDQTYDATTNPYTVTGLAQGVNYTVKVRAACGGSSFSAWSDPATFTTLGIHDAIGSNVNLYPNPATSSVTVSGMGGEATVSVVDMNGRTVYTARANESLTIDLGGYARGAYFVRISGEQTMAIRKLIVK